ncbi:MAG: secretion protein HlyD [Gemmatimonadetes bacterium]|nr:secretion protein HlyD [Gemmatimonadota bacterium]
MTKPRRILSIVLVLIIAVVTTAIIRGRNQPLLLIGVVDANDIVVTPRVQGRLDSLLVDEGSEVKAGQLVASLESSELAAQAASVAAATTGATAQLGESRASALQLSGTTAGTLSAAQARVASAKATLAREHAQLTQDSVDAGRASAMLRAGAVSPAEVEKANTAYRSQQSVVAARLQEVSAAEADLAGAQSGTHAVAAAQSAVATTAARVRGARADSIAAATRLNYAELRAPVSGIVQVIAARRGELVGPGSPVMVIVDPDHIWVRVAAPETDAGAVAIGDSLDVRLPNGQSLKGRVISKGAEGEFATQHDVSSSKRDIRAVAFRVAIPNPRRVLVPGMTVQVLLPTKP